VPIVWCSRASTKPIGSEGSIRPRPGAVCRSLTFARASGFPTIWRRAAPPGFWTWCWGRRRWKPTSSTEPMPSTRQAIASQQERSELILAYLPRVRWIAMNVSGRLPYTVALEDLISIGVLGLISAIDRFDASQNVKLETYADYRIRGSILDSIRGLDGVPAHKRVKLKMIRRAAAAAAQRFCQSPDEGRGGGELGLPVGGDR